MKVEGCLEKHTIFMIFFIGFINKIEKQVRGGICMKKSSKIIAICLSVSFLFTGCSVTKKTTNNTNTDGVVIESMMNGEKRSITYKNAPNKVVSLAGFATEMLLALGLEDKIVGYAWQDNAVLPQYKETFEKLQPLCNPGMDPGKEKVLSMEPDIVLSWASTSNDDYFSYQNLTNSGILSYGFACEQEGATMESVYQDFINLGKIFRVEKRAEALVEEMKKNVADVQQKLQGKEAVSVFVCDVGSSEEQAFTAGGGLVADIIKASGGKNSIDTTTKNWTRVSWEKIAEANPDWIVIDYYTNKEDVQGTIDFLKKHPALKDLKAVKEEKFITIGLTDISASERMDDTVQLLSASFFPNN